MESVYERMESIFELFRGKLDSLLEYDDDIAVDSCDELLERYNKYIEENYED